AGTSSTASGLGAVAIGPSSADGSFAIAMGLQNSASGHFSVALGKNADTNGKQGAIVISDGSAEFFADKLTALANNEIAMRGSGGIRLRTQMDLSTGCNLAAGGGS